jgi:hypothetical protein
MTTANRIVLAQEQPRDGWRGVRTGRIRRFSITVHGRNRDGEIYWFASENGIGFGPNAPSPECPHRKTGAKRPPDASTTRSVQGIRTGPTRPPCWAGGGRSKVKNR